MISSSLFLSFFASIFGVFPEFSSKFPPRFFEAFSFSLSFFGAPYFAIAQYGLLSPYFAIAQYGLLSPYFAIAQYGLLSPYCLRQYGLLSPYFAIAQYGLWAPGVALRLPRAVFWRTFRALIPITKFLTSAVGRCLHPIAIYGEGVADRPGLRSHSHRKIDNDRNAGVYSPSPTISHLP